MTQKLTGMQNQPSSLGDLIDALARLVRRRCRDAAWFGASVQTLDLVQEALSRVARDHGQTLETAPETLYPLVQTVVLHIIADKSRAAVGRRGDKRRVFIPVGGPADSEDEDGQAFQLPDHRDALAHGEAAIALGRVHGHLEAFLDGSDPVARKIDPAKRERMLLAFMLAVAWDRSGAEIAELLDVSKATVNGDLEFLRFHLSVKVNGALESTDA